jgi:PAS domain S-box-containing protein
MESTWNSDALAEIRSQLVDDLYSVLLRFGGLAVLGGIVRNWIAGIPHQSLPLLFVYVVLLCALLARRHLPSRFRGFLAILAMLVAGFQALLFLGLAGPGSFLLPTAVILAWMVLDRRSAIATAILSVLGLTVCAWIGIHNDTLADRLTSLNRTPAAWVQLGLVHLLVGALILSIGRRLIHTILERQVQTRAEKDRFQGILEGIQEALFVHELPGGVVLETNARAEEMFGTTRERLLTSAPYEYSANIAPWTKAEGMEHARKAITEGPQQFLWRSRREDGSLFWTEIAMRTFPVGGQVRLLVTIRDVEERVQDKLELQRLNSELEARVARRTATIEESRQELQAFSYAVSHDLRAPLRAIDGFARVLAEDHGDSLPDDAKGSLNRILAGANRMNRLIDALLDLSRIDRKPYRRILVDMATVVGELREELAAGGTEGRPATEWRIAALHPCQTDPDLVRQIWANLLGNAVKFTGTTSRPLIEVASQERADGIWYEVRDNGAGFDMAHARNLFGMFQRLHDASIDGLGIGLATVKRILRRLEGEIEFESVPGKGATFRFRPGPSRWDETSRDLPEV